MGTARGDLALVAAARRDQFPGFVRSRYADVASNGRSDDRIGAGLYQCLQWRA